MYKNSTVLDKKILNALNKKSFISAIIVLCAGVLTIIASVFMFIDKDKYYGIIYLVCSFLLIALAGYLLIYLNKINKKIVNSVNEYDFEDDGFIIKDSLGNFSKITYQYVFKLKKNNEYLFIYINKVNAYPVNLNAFENGEDKNEFLKFIIQKTNKIIK